MIGLLAGKQGSLQPQPFHCLRSYNHTLNIKVWPPNHPLLPPSAGLETTLQFHCHHMGRVLPLGAQCCDSASIVDLGLDVIMTDCGLWRWRVIKLYKGPISQMRLKFYGMGTNIHVYAQKSFCNTKNPRGTQTYFCTQSTQNENIGYKF